MRAAEDQDDAALARAAATGDDAAFEMLVSRHKAGLYRLLRTYLGDADETWEAIQETFIAAWRALPRFDAERSFGAWLRTIAINKARDRGRRIRLRRLVFGPAPGSHEDGLDYPDPARPADLTLIASERDQALRKAMSSLPEALRVALILTAMEGYSQREAGEILGITEKSVETRVYRARRLLKDSLAGLSD